MENATVFAKWVSRIDAIVYRAFTSLLFDELCRRSGLTSVELTRRLRQDLQRPKLSRQTLAAWRAGDQDCPAAALYAVGAMIGIAPGDVATQLSVRLLQHPARTEHEKRAKQLILRLYPETAAATEG
jgi:hypothetical protein